MYSIKEINDKKKWESFLSSITFYPFFQSWNWGEVQKRLGFEVERIGFYGEKENLLGICQIVTVRAKRGHYFHLRHGPVFAEYKTEYLDYLFSYVRESAKKKGISFLRISPLVSEETLSDYLHKNHFINSPIHNLDAEICWVLDISKPEEVLLKEMRKSHRYLIRKAQTLDIKLIRTKNINDIDKFIPLYKQLSQIKHFIPHKGVREEFITFSKDNEEVLFLVEYQGKIIAGALIAFIGDMAIYRHSASDKNYNNIPASYLIQWEAIKEAKKRGLRFYNFWGIALSDSPHHPWKGLTLFKTGFGGEKRAFIHTQDLPLSLWYWKSYAIDFLTKIKKGY